MALDPRQATVIEAIATGVCVGLVVYLAYLVFSFFGSTSPFVADCVEKVLFH
jgi:hypothetical protein